MVELWNFKRRLLIGGPVLIILGLVVYLIRRSELVLILPVIGVVVLIIGVIYKPHKKQETVQNDDA